MRRRSQGHAEAEQWGCWVPLQPESLAWHISHLVAVPALGLQETVKFLHKPELLVMCGGCKLLVESPGGQFGI